MTRDCESLPLPDRLLQLAALRESRLLCQSAQVSLERGLIPSDLGHLLAQLETRLVYLLRQFPVSRSEYLDLAQRHDQLRALLAPPSRPGDHLGPWIPSDSSGSFNS
jgi:hypothetical protein